MANAYQKFENETSSPTLAPSIEQHQQPVSLPQVNIMSPPAQQPGVYYMQQPTNQVTYVTQTATTNMSNMHSSIPVLPLGVAIALCIVNCIMPGIGTIIASFSLFCCGKIPRSGSGAFGAFCLNFWIGWLQLLTVWFFFAGWIWSIIWGVYFITNASDYNRQEQAITTTTTTTSTIPFPPPQYSRAIN